MAIPSGNQPGQKGPLDNGQRMEWAVLTSHTWLGRSPRCGPLIIKITAIAVSDLSEMHKCHYPHHTDEEIEAWVG